MLLNQTLSRLKESGYHLQFRREATGLYCDELELWIVPDGFVVDKQYRFEDVIPDGDRIIYAISTLTGFRGFLVETCFVYEDNISIELQRKLQESDYLLTEAI